MSKVSQSSYTNRLKRCTLLFLLHTESRPRRAVSHQNMEADFTNSQLLDPRFDSAHAHVNGDLIKKEGHTNLKQGLITLSLMSLLSSKSTADEHLTNPDSRGGGAHEF